MGIERAKVLDRREYVLKAGILGNNISAPTMHVPSPNDGLSHRQGTDDNSLYAQEPDEAKVSCPVLEAGRLMHCVTAHVPQRYKLPTLRIHFMGNVWLFDVCCVKEMKSIF